MAILNRRGNEADFDASKMLPGEWAVSLDTRYVRMCFAPGICLRMATYESFENDMEEIKDILAKSQSIQQAVTAINANVNSKAEIVVESTEEAEKYRDEAKMYAENASAVTGVEIATQEIAGIIKGGDNYISPDGTLQLITTASSTTLPNSHAGRVKFNEIVGGIEQKTTSGKNLLDCSGLVETESNGVTFTPVYSTTEEHVKNGYPLGSLMYINANGTATGDAKIEIYYGADHNLAEGTYILNGCPANGSDTTYFIQVWNNTTGLGGEDCGNGKSFDIASSTDTIFFRIRVGSGTTVSNLKFYPMVRLATETDATYEPFTNGASPNLEYPQDINGSVISGLRVHRNNFLNVHDVYIQSTVTANKNKDGTLTIINPLDYEASGIGIMLQGLLPAGDYTLSNLSSDGGCYIMRNTADYSNFLEYGKSKTFSYDGKSYLRIVYINQPANSTRTYKLMLNEGVEATEYEPYQGKEITLSNPITLYGDVMSAKEIERKYGVITVDSNTVLYAHPYSTDERLVFYYRVYRAGENPKVLCTHLPTVTYSALLKTQDCVYIEASGSTVISLPITLTPTIEDARAWLIDNGVKFVQSLEESTTEELPTADQIALNSLPTYDGVTYVEFIDVGVQPSVSIDYGTSKVGGYTLEGLLAGINGELQSQLNNDRITALESAVVNNV